MSLAEAVTDIVDQMELEAKEVYVFPIGKDPERWMMKMEATLKSYAKQLRTAVKAAGGTPIVPPANLASPAAQHYSEIEKARAEFRKDPNLVSAEEGIEPRMVLCVGGDSDGDTIPIPADKQAGEKTRIGAGLYELREDGKLQFVMVMPR